MKKTILFATVALVLFSLSLESRANASDPQQQAPKSAVVIKIQTGDYYQHITVIDLENNELVLLRYSPNKLDNIVRTGIFVNPEQQKEFMTQIHSGTKSNPISQTE